MSDFWIGGLTHDRAICHRYQEIRGDRCAFSCECGGEGCPLRPLYAPSARSQVRIGTRGTPDVQKGAQRD